MSRHSGPPPGARAVYLEDGSGEICGYVAERALAPGSAYPGGVNAYRGPSGKPWRCFANFPDAELALRGLRQRPNHTADWAEEKFS